jgi:hypothetical protein
MALTQPPYTWTGSVTFKVNSVVPAGTIWDVLVDKSLTVLHSITGPGTLPKQNAQSLTYFSMIDFLQGIMRDHYSGTVEVGSISGHRYKEMHDCESPNWRKRIADGEIINNPVVNSKVSTQVRYERHANNRIRYSPLIAASWGNYHDYVNGSWLTNPSITFLPPTVEDIEDVILEHVGISRPFSFHDAKQTAINSAFGEINSGTFNYLEEMGEGKETVLYIASVFSRIASLMKAVKRGQFKGIVPKTHARVMKLARNRARRNGTLPSVEYGKIVLDYTTQAWMELRFAIRPLMYSVEDAIELHQEGLRSQTGRTTVNGQSREVSNDYRSASSAGNNVRITKKTKIVFNRHARCGILLQIDAVIADMRTLGFTNLAGTAWELTFLSWAADYFVNLDGLLYHLTPDIGVQKLAAWSSTNDTYDIVTTITQHDDTTGELLDTLHIVTSKEVYQREPVSKPSLITIDVNIDVTKLADLGALFYGILRSGKK